MRTGMRRSGTWLSRPPSVPSAERSGPSTGCSAACEITGQAQAGHTQGRNVGHHRKREGPQVGGGTLSERSTWVPIPAAARKTQNATLAAAGDQSCSPMQVGPPIPPHLQRRQVDLLAQQVQAGGQLQVGQQLRRGHPPLLEADLQQLGAAHLKRGGRAQRRLAAEGSTHGRRMGGRPAVGSQTARQSCCREA